MESRGHGRLTPGAITLAIAISFANHSVLSSVSAEVVQRGCGFHGNSNAVRAITRRTT
jgi:hypothetical protein